MGSKMIVQTELLTDFTAAQRYDVNTSKELHTQLVCVGLCVDGETKCMCTDCVNAPAATLLLTGQRAEVSCEADDHQVAHRLSAVWHRPSSSSWPTQRGWSRYQPLRRSGNTDKEALDLRASRVLAVTLPDELRNEITLSFRVSLYFLLSVKDKSSHSYKQKHSNCFSPGCHSSLFSS